MDGKDLMVWNLEFAKAALQGLVAGNGATILNVTGQLTKEKAEQYATIAFQLANAMCEKLPISGKPLDR